MRVHKRLLVGSLLVSAVASAAIGWAIAASGAGGRADDTVVIDGSDVTFQQPSLGPTASIGMWPISPAMPFAPRQMRPSSTNPAAIPVPILR